MSLVTSVRTMLDESTASFWTDQHIYDGINQSLLELYSENAHIFTSTATFTTTASDSFIPVPSAIMIPKFILGTGKELWPTTGPKLEQYNRNWLGSPVGYPRHWWLWDIEHLRPYPRPDAAYVFRLVGVPWPTEISATNTDIASTVAHPNFTHAVAFRSAARLLEFSRPDLSDHYASEADASIQEFKRLIRSSGNSIWNMAPRSSRVSGRSGVVALGRGIR